MIDGIRRIRRTTNAGLRPADKHHADKVVVGDHSQDHMQPNPEQFTPPTDIAAAEDADPNISTTSSLNQPEAKKSFKEWLGSLSKKQWIIIGVVAVLLIGGGVGAFFVLHKSPKPVVATKKSATTKTTPAPPAPTTVASHMSGLQVDPSVNDRPVTGVMVENSELARPQSGIDQADVIFEAVAEGGITRFLLLFQDGQPDYLGPVRSVRPYYIAWAMGFDAAIAHAGGSPEALATMRNLNVKDLDQFYNGGYYTRISSRYAPHNLYTSMGQLRDIETNKGYGKGQYTPLLRRAETPSKTPTARSIDMVISSSTFNVHYDYDATTNSYKRSQDGAPHNITDKAGNLKQLQPKVVVALVMTQGIEADDLHTSYGVLGSGAGYIFQDGNVLAVTWKKASNTDQFTFTDAAGHPAALDAGQTWFTVVNNTNKVSFKP
jgi:hypothetical protein